jgi:hypothetical protein
MAMNELNKRDISHYIEVLIQFVLNKEPLFLRNYSKKNSLHIEAIVLLSFVELIKTPLTMNLVSIKKIKQIQIKNLTEMIY